MDSPKDPCAQTSLFYDSPINATAYKDRADKIDLSEHYAWVLQYTANQPGLKVLDLGCGPGRDTAYFLSRSFAVTSIDASSAMIDLTRTYNPQARVQRMEELDESDEFDLVWASASLLHLPRSILHPVFQKIRTSLRPCGIFYASFKLGADDFVDNKGRFFSLVTGDEIESIVHRIPGFEILEKVQRASLEGNETPWLNLILKKSFEPKPWYQTLLEDGASSPSFSRLNERAEPKNRESLKQALSILSACTDLSALELSRIEKRKRNGAFIRRLYSLEHHKLVRDRIPELAQKVGRPFPSRTITDDREFFVVLFDKLREELLEYQLEPGHDELSDVAEVLEALLSESVRLGTL